MKLVRSLQRGVQVMRALQDAPALSLAELHRITGLPKATLLRVLLTLEAERLVFRSVGEGLFRYRAVALAPTWYRNQRLAEIAAPHLTALQERTLWPSDLVTRQGYFMELVETSRCMPRITISRDTLGERVDIAASAVGRAYLAFCGARERRSILAHLERHPELRGELGPLDRTELDAAIVDAQQRGYATRVRHLSPRLARLGGADDGLDAIAVPVIHGGRVFGAINLVWPRRLDLLAGLVTRHLRHLQSTATAIGAEAARRPRPGRAPGQG